MRISPIQINPIFIKPLKTNCPASVVKNKKELEFKGIRNVFYPVMGSDKVSYSYKPIASIKPITEPVGHYDDLDKFAQLFADKINSQLLIPTEEDIQNLINRIKKQTGADEQLIRETVLTLGYYANYGFLQIFEKLIEDKNITAFGIPFRIDNNETYDFSSNSAIGYLVDNKDFLDYPKLNYKDPEKIAYIIDDMSLSQLEHYKTSTDEKEKAIFNKFLKNIDKYVFVFLKGWEVKTKSNGYKAANAFWGSGYLEDLAVEIIKRIKSGETRDEIYCKDYKERFARLTEDKSPDKKVDFTTYEPDMKPELLTNESLLRYLSPKAISEGYIKDALKYYLDLKSEQFEDKKQIQRALLKYLDEMTAVYSIDSLAIALKKMGRNIEANLRQQGYKKDDTVYVVPEMNKSYSLITSMYANLNGIKPKNINPMTNITGENVKKARVILDDLSASGSSEGCNASYIDRKYMHNKTPVIYAPVVLCNMAKAYISRPQISYVNGHFFDKDIHDMAEMSNLAYSVLNPDIKTNTAKITEELKEHIKQNFKLMNYDDCLALAKILCMGYKYNGLCIAFPYMIPDNASDIAGLLLRNVLRVDNCQTNKALGFLYSHKYANEPDYQDFEMILSKLDEIY